MTSTRKLRLLEKQKLPIECRLQLPNTLFANDISFFLYAYARVSRGCIFLMTGVRCRGRTGKPPALQPLAGQLPHVLLTNLSTLLHLLVDQTSTLKCSPANFQIAGPSYNVFCCSDFSSPDVVSQLTYLVGSDLVSWPSQPPSGRKTASHEDNVHRIFERNGVDLTRRGAAYVDQRPINNLASYVP